MKRILKGDIYCEMWYMVCAAMLPVITVGMIGGQTGLAWARVVGWIAAGIGAVALIGLIIRVASNRCVSAGERPVVVEIVSELLALPYALMLSALIAMLFGIEASAALWIAAAFALLEIVGCLTPARKK